MEERKRMSEIDEKFAEYFRKMMFSQPIKTNYYSGTAEKGSEFTLPSEVVVPIEVIEALADNGCCPNHDAEIRRQTLDEFVNRIIGNSTLKSTGEMVIEIRMDIFNFIYEQMKGEANV